MNGHETTMAVVMAACQHCSRWRGGWGGGGGAVVVAGVGVAAVGDCVAGEEYNKRAM